MINLISSVAESALLIIILLLLFSAADLEGTIWQIKLDGTGDFISIQEGITAAAAGDTILVYPGTYYENLDFLGKAVTVASLCLTTGDDNYKYSTIINGNQNGSCVQFVSGETYDSLLCGFTLTNGSGVPPFTNSPSFGGGGIFLGESQATIRNTVITRNLVSGGGGGVYAMSSQIKLEGVTVRDNRATRNGGGIFIGKLAAGGQSGIHFDEDNLCSVYANLGIMGNDISIAEAAIDYVNVVVDTFTVLELDDYHILRYSTTSQSVGNIDLTVNHAVITEKINADLYVATTGCNDNSGLNPGEPLATINHALKIIESDSLLINTIHIADGTYSYSENDNWFPLNMRSYVSFRGESMEGTVLDAENRYYSCLFYGNMINYNNSIKNMTMINCESNTGWGLLYLADQQRLDDTIELRNITISNCKTTNGGIASLNLSSYLYNINYLNNQGGTGILFFNHSPNPSTHIIENSRIKGNSTWSQSHQNVPMAVAGRPLYDQLVKAQVINTEISDCSNTQFHFHAIAGLGVANAVELDIINCTFVNNSVQGNGGFLYTRNGTDILINIYNTIMFGNHPREIYLICDSIEFPTVVNIGNSLIMGGLNNIHIQYPWIEVNWLDGNLDLDPLFLDEGVFPYMLSENSPCINAGTLDLPDHINLPDTDLAGNPRIQGSSIDIGAYEWQGTGTTNDVIHASESMVLNCYPNPFNPEIRINLSLSGSGFTTVNIYNIKGQKVKTIMKGSAERGEYSFTWNGTDDKGNRVTSGQYLVHASQDNEFLSQKITLLK
jgi:hypothetical protein